MLIIFVIALFLPNFIKCHLFDVVGYFMELEVPERMTDLTLEVAILLKNQSSSANQYYKTSSEKLFEYIDDADNFQVSYCGQRIQDSVKGKFKALMEFESRRYKNSDQLKIHHKYYPENGLNNTILLLFNLPSLLNFETKKYINISFERDNYLLKIQSINIFGSMCLDKVDTNLDVVGKEFPQKIVEGILSNITKKIHDTYDDSVEVFIDKDLKSNKKFNLHEFEAFILRLMKRYKLSDKQKPRINIMQQTSDHMVFHIEIGLNSTQFKEYDFEVWDFQFEAKYVQSNLENQWKVVQGFIRPPLNLLENDNYELRLLQIFGNNIVKKLDNFMDRISTQFPNFGKIIVCGKEIESYQLKKVFSQTHKLPTQCFTEKETVNSFLIDCMVMGQDMTTRWRGQVETSFDPRNEGHKIQKIEVECQFENANFN
ncbi:unnamed protein product [Caenorhabditis angaria]|uniref:DUF38 domain-containing protein n=1 Tax=Caenorhabditis angaria TaxID=860376 RepID=A0A9P1MWT5_9PELO|nr:unnamed protein product [Caenorhabditis angaria]